MIEPAEQQQDVVYRLRDGLVIVEQDEAGKPYFVVQDTGTGKVYGFNQASIKILRALDGKTTVSELIARMSGTPDAVERVRANVTSFLAKVQRAGLLDGGPPAASEPVRPGQRWMAALTKYNPFYLKLGVKNPSPVFRPLSKVFFPIFSYPGLMVLALLFAGSIFLITRDLKRFWYSFLIFQFFRWWVAAYALLFFSAVLHETGHAMACMRFGGDVRAMGFILYLLQPGCYTDVTDSWLFPSRVHRIVVSLAGVYIESFLFTFAIGVWYWTPHYSAPNQIAFIFAIILITRILINLIPFLRLDGYFILSDLVRVRNLRPRAFAYVISLIPWVGRSWRATRLSRREKTILLLYGLVAVAFIVIALSATVGKVYGILTHWSPHGALLFWTLTIGMVVPAALSVRKMLLTYRSDGEGSQHPAAREAVS